MTMEIFWFCVVAFMLAMYTVLDGFDFGAGILHLFVAKTDEERRSVLHAIGPVWDGNEVWLIAAGGTLYFAFPRLYASSFSGFYLPLMIVLWLFMMRGLGIELRHHVDHPLWKSFWDTVFALGSSLPLDESGYFFAPLWTSFTVQPDAGILDWFTVLMGLTAFCALAVHGGNYLAMKTTGDVQVRSRMLSNRALPLLAVLVVATLAAASSIRAEIWSNFSRAPWGWIFPFFALAGMGGMIVFGRSAQDAKSFFSSSLFVAAMLSSTAFGLFPAVLPASTDPAYGLTVYNAAAGSYGLGVGVGWWVAGIILALGYSAYLFYTFHGKVKLEKEGY
jgi:cytochrome d ubiquinol oxidase subunit II